MDQLRQLWDSFRPDTQANILGGLIVALVVGAIGLSWRVLLGGVKAIRLRLAQPISAATPTTLVGPAGPVLSELSEADPLQAERTQAALSERRLLTQLIIDSFKLEEINTELLPRLNLDAEQVLIGDSKEAKVAYLAGYCVRHGQLPELRAAVLAARPHLNTPDQALPPPRPLLKVPLRLEPSSQTSAS